MHDYASVFIVSLCVPPLPSFAMCDVRVCVCAYAAGGHPATLSRVDLNSFVLSVLPRARSYADMASTRVQKNHASEAATNAVAQVSTP